jgi:ATP-dependent Lon protease
MRNVLGLYQKIVSLTPYLPDELYITAMNIDDGGKLADFIASNSSIDLSSKQKILETVDLRQRLESLSLFITRELEVLELGNKIQSQVKTEIDKTQREYFLREQLKAIQKELGEVDERQMEINELRDKIAKANMSAEAQKEAERELNRLEKMPPAAAEYTVARTYLDWLVSLPWSQSTTDNLEIEPARQILDQDHYNLERVKERILEYLAVRKLKKDMKGPILCFVGPPGVGKTSLGMSIARTLGRKFIRMSLGGIRDEAEIRGHRRTYVGALPGRIIQGIRKAGSNNPVFMLDEIDKVGMDFRGDPAAALLEVLDPEQNFSFVDHYLDVPFDLSQVMFITTANILDTVPPALRDRMEVLELPGYTEEEKLEIAKRHLLPKQFEMHGITGEIIKIDDQAIVKIIREYTREAGLRNLEREIANICRKVAKQIAEVKATSVQVGANNIHEYLGVPRFIPETAEIEGEIGMATGLAWTPNGGEILFVEATRMRGKKGLTLTGQLGDVMKESAQAALSYIRSRASSLKIPEDFFEKYDIHIHVPAGAIPKDGPSAGVTIAVALISLLSERPVRHDIAMTGEITLRGKILPVGGIKEKVLGAKRAGIRNVILPRKNEKDLEDIKEDIKKEMKFIFCENISDIIEVALLPHAPVAKRNKRLEKVGVSKHK